MIKCQSLVPCVVAFVLFACNKADPVANNAVAPSDAVLETSAEGLAAPANAAAAEAAQQAAVPVADDGMGWTVRPGDRAALYGPVGASAALAIQCREEPGAGKRLAFLRYAHSAGGDDATMSFTGNGTAASLPAGGITDAVGPGGHWQAIAQTGDMGRAVARTFDGPAAVVVSVGGASKLVVPPSDEARRTMADCLR
ncbi:MAG: hypothetical protein ABIP07_01405 [Sphingomicrobium sp.]